MLRVVELFAGVGGFRVGLERVDRDFFRTVWANQWEPGQARQWAYKCYESHFGADANCVNEDISKVTGQVPEHDLLVGGFPCQDYSVASTGAKGIEGKKGVLWWSIDEILRLRHPRYVLLENVDRLLKSPAKQRGRDFGIILKCLQDLGYAVEWRVVNAADYGMVQRRRRTFIFACHKDTRQYGTMHAFLMEQPGNLPRNMSVWTTQTGFFAGCFPVCERPPLAKAEGFDLRSFSDLLDISNRFQADFMNAGVMVDGLIFTTQLTPSYEGRHAVLGNVLEASADEKLFIAEDELDKWRFMKGAKRIERTSKTGYAYNFSEGAIAFPDPLDRPARTMLTSEGTSNRSSHVVADPKTGRLRRLAPVECERVNGFDDGWTDTGMPERQRYFIMGNALVVPLVSVMGERIKALEA